MDNEFPDRDEEYDLIDKDDFEVLKEIQAQLNYKRNVPNNDEQISRPIDEQKSLKNDFDQPSTSFQTDGSGQHSTANSKKRNYDELFGDISDLLETDSFSEIYQPKEKKPCWDQPNDIIKAIIDARKKMQEEDSDDVSNRNEDQDKKNGNISLRVPSWNFIAVTRPFDSRRIYVKVKKERNTSVGPTKSICNLLSVSYNQLKAEAEEIIENNAKHASLATTQSFEDNKTTGSELWVDKYKPKTYMELLSNESVNRQFLHWLKLWDKIVFDKEISPQKKKINISAATKFEDADQDDVDSKGYPTYKIVLLTGPPGLGKTTLAHLAAKHAGYNIIEVNASDERGPDAFRQILRASTQMKAVIGANPRPNCLILDEIDGAPTASIEELLKFVQGKSSSKDKKNKIKTAKEGKTCQRPIICICNEPYTPSLRPLKNFALVINVPPVSNARLVQRLMEIAQKENLNAHQNDLLKLVENSDCDIRSCLGALQYMGNVNTKYNVSLGLKDTKKGLFDTWKEIFKVPVGKTGILSTRERRINILKIVQSDDSEKLAQGIFHNYPLNCIEKIQNTSVAAEWFQFYDEISTSVLHNQSWSIMPYTNYAFFAWHLNLSTMQIPKLLYPAIVFETNQKIARNTSILATVRRNRGIDDVTLIMDIIPILPILLNPQIRTVSGHLYSSKEKAHLSHVINIMLNFGLTLVQEKNTEQRYEYKLDPDICEISYFSGCKNHAKIPYTVLQIVSQELQTEYVKRSINFTEVANKDKDKDKEKEEQNKVKEYATSENSMPTNKSMTADSNASGVPNSSKRTNNKSPVQISKHRNFFGEIVVSDDNTKKILKTSPKSMKTSQIQNIVMKYGAWYKYKEGFSNAVRRHVFMLDFV